MQRALIAIALLSAAARAAAAQPDSFIDHARVRHVEPEYESVQVPRQECGSQWVTEPPAANNRHYGGVIIGGVAGAVLGNQVGKGRGREAATAAGAVIGALAGDRIANGSRWQADEPSAREVTRCHTVVDVENRITGYRVEYEYNGRHYTTFMRDEPGHTMPVKVTVAPAERQFQRHSRR